MASAATVDSSWTNVAADAPPKLSRGRTKELSEAPRSRSHTRASRCRSWLTSVIPLTVPGKGQALRVLRARAPLGHGRRTFGYRPARP